ncbi:AAA domain-containing protein [Halorussus sp. GCM10023401]|uniref:AAA domain-containing protein n=1 Tax=Halorussus sp. GCM10023401 TaxID=3252680 RepID=UPI0020A01F6F|nr:AAA domain-containing protein [Halorussus vallis]USZ77703.1 C-terminal helicase domain-containing protein [Halorussus vallis]
MVRVDAEGPERVREGHSYANPAEAERAASLVAELLEAGVRPENVGVITPYDAQVDEIRRALSDAGVPNHGDVEVDTVDAFQGGEREAVVVSLVRSNDEGNVGFLGRGEDGPRRLNVALTRAERFLALVGDWETLRASTDGNDGENGDDGENGYGENGDDAADLYRSLYDYLDERSRTRTTNSAVERSGLLVRPCASGYRHGRPGTPTRSCRRRR